MTNEEFTDADKLKELRAELAWRHKVYARSIKAGRMSQALASRKIRLLNAIIADYERADELFSNLRR